MRIEFTRGHPAWDWAWSAAIGATATERAARNTKSNEVWQCMGAQETLTHDIVEYRHRDLGGNRVNLQLLCHLKDRVAIKVLVHHRPNYLYPVLIPLN